MTEEEAPPDAAPEPPEQSERRQQEKKFPGISRKQRMPSERQADTLNGMGEVIAKAMEGLEATVDCINRASYETSGLRRFKYLMRAKVLGTEAGATITAAIGRLDPEAYTHVEPAADPGAYGRIARILSRRQVEDTVEPRSALPTWSHARPRE